jgi:hypothetical protein
LSQKHPSLVIASEAKQSYAIFVLYVP